MDDHQRSDGIPVTRFTLQSIYAQSDDEKLQFEYESGNTNILVIWSYWFWLSTLDNLCWTWWQLIEHVTDNDKIHWITKFTSLP